jgi:hypothetical protein
VFARDCLDLSAGVNERSSATQFIQGFPTEALPPVLLLGTRLCRLR